MTEGLKTVKNFEYKFEKTLGNAARYSTNFCRYAHLGKKIIHIDYLSQRPAWKSRQKLASRRGVKNFREFVGYYGGLVSHRAPRRRCGIYAARKTRDMLALGG